MTDSVRFGRCSHPFLGSRWSGRGQRPSEVNPDALRVLDHRRPTLKHLGDVSATSQKVVDDIVFGRGADVVAVAGVRPASSCPKQDDHLGLDGKDPKLFFEFVRVASLFTDACTRAYLPRWRLLEKMVPGITLNVDRVAETLDLGMPIWVAPRTSGGRTDGVSSGAMLFPRETGLVLFPSRGRPSLGSLCLPPGAVEACPPSGTFSSPRTDHLGLQTRAHGNTLRAGFPLVLKGSRVNLPTVTIAPRKLRASGARQRACVFHILGMRAAPYFGECRRHW